SSILWALLNCSLSSRSGSRKLPVDVNRAADDHGKHEGECANGFGLGVLRHQVMCGFLGLEWL
ncbi:MAG: hypothetical protein ACO3P7_16510, partial [bacterium]